jgi:hypothetical protein
MLRYPIDHRYPDMPQGSTTYWAPDGLDTTSHPAVTRDSEDRHVPSSLRPNQLASSAYASATALSLTQRDPYPTMGQTQTDCQEQFPCPPQQYIPSVNYAAPPYDFADYPVSYPFVSS